MEDKKQIERFRELAKDIKPIALVLTEILKKHGVDNTAYLYVNADGWLNFTIHGMSSELSRVDENEPFTLKEVFQNE